MKGEDFEFDAASASPEDLAKWLDQRVQEVLSEVERTDVWKAVVGGAKSIEFVVQVLQEIYLEIVMYQPDAIEAAVASIGQMPRDMPVAWFDEMLHHQVEEFDHGEMALRDYVALGGIQDAARSRPQSPSAFAVAAVWRNITHKRNPFVYLGAVYLFDALTPIVTERAKVALAKAFQKNKGLEFITHHATADIEHADKIRQLIIDVAQRYPEQKQAIAYGFEYFAHVYPAPVWSSAMRRVERRAAAAKASVAAE